MTKSLLGCVDRLDEFSSDQERRLTELAVDVVAGVEKLLTKNGAAYVAIVDARKLDYYHTLTGC